MPGMRVAPGDPVWWLARLERKLVGRQSTIRRRQDYYDGNHPLAFASPQFDTLFGGLFADFADNWVPTVVDGAAERLQVEGFRYGDDVTVDSDANRIWQANRLDARAEMIHTVSILHGVAYALVDPFDEVADGVARVTPEHPSQMVVEMRPGSYDRRAAALKLWVDEVDGSRLATLYLPGEIYKFRAVGTGSAKVALPSGFSESDRWAPRDVVGEAWPLTHEIGVPVVPFVNSPQISGEGRSDVDSVIPMQDAINKTWADLMVASEYSSVKQRWATGMEIPRDPVTGEQVEAFESAVKRLWIAEDPDTKFGEFGTTDLAQFIGVIEALVRHLSSQTRTPSHYLQTGNTAGLSGESLRASETGLVAKVRRKMRHFGEAHEEVVGLAFAAAGRADRASVFDAETVWANPEYRTEAEMADALMKRGTFGVPQRQLWEDAGYSPQQIARFRQMRREESLDAQGFDLAGLTLPQPDPVPAPTEV